jgi:hypothetical protein
MQSNVGGFISDQLCFARELKNHLVLVIAICRINQQLDTRAQLSGWSLLLIFHLEDFSPPKD